MAVLRQGAMLKTEIINRLGAKHGFTRYLEICTPTTGIRYGEVDRRQFTVCSRLMYRWCPEVSDGFKIDYPVLGEAIEPVIADLQGQGLRYDVILVDPWHGYEASLRDMHLALSVLSEGGVLVVHDCSPQSLDLAGPSFVGGCWLSSRRLGRRTTISGSNSCQSGNADSSAPSRAPLLSNQPTNPTVRATLVTATALIRIAGVLLLEFRKSDNSRSNTPKSEFRLTLLKS